MTLPAQEVLYPSGYSIQSYYTISDTSFAFGDTLVIRRKIVNSDVFKVFSGGGSKATVLVKQTPIDIEIKGKPSMIITSAEANTTSENLRRYPICFLDNSDDQTLSIMVRQSEEDIVNARLNDDQVRIGFSRVCNASYCIS